MSSIDAFYPLLPPLHPPRARRARPPKPNNNQIYSKSLPISTFPLPPLIPHNPISLLHIAYVLVSECFSRPDSHPKRKLRGYYSTGTRSVHVTDPEAIRFLWESGFFGKGSLSRSEPTWLDREMKRQGLKDSETNENITATRREERRRFKEERARKAQEAIDEKLTEEMLVDKIASAYTSGTGGAGKPTLRSKYEGVAEAALLSPAKQSFFGEMRSFQPPPSEPEKEEMQDAPVGQEHSLGMNGAVVPPLMAVPKPTRKDIQNQEHLQLHPEEAFFLAYALGVLEIHPDPTSSPEGQKPLSNSDLLNLFTRTPTSLLTPKTPPDPASHFLLAYSTYHHFRSLGWIVRPGMKFGVDWLLYLRGPVFSHAEFAVVVMPAFKDEYWHRRGSNHRRRRRRRRKQETRAESGDTGADAEIEDEDEGEGENEDQDEDENKTEFDPELGFGTRESKSWHWLHSLQRVQAQVRKSLVIAWVEIPPPSSHPPAPLTSPTASLRHHPPLSTATRSSDGDAMHDTSDASSDDIDITATLKRYKVREMVLKRWIPNRSRD